MGTDPRISWMIKLIRAALRPAPGAGRIALALGLGVLCHTLFAAGLLAMFNGLSESPGTVPWPMAALVNGALIAQFPLAHSLFLTGSGGLLLAQLFPGPYGQTLATTTYANTATAQLLVLFALWTPSGVVWWQVEGVALWMVSADYATSWHILLKASFDAGAEMQSGALGWMSLLVRTRPMFPDMPTLGLLRVSRQPIYVAFVMMLGTPPVWTPDQLVLAVSFSQPMVFCPAPETTPFCRPHGARFNLYCTKVPNMLPHLTAAKDRPDAQLPDDL
jgi:hypothetical protein